MNTISVRVNITGVLIRLPDYAEIIITSDRAEEILWITWSEFYEDMDNHIANFMRVYHNNPWNWKTRT